MELEKIKKKLKRKLNDKRYEHTLGVSYTAGCLAMKYGLDVNKAILAGLLHDCAKYMSGEEMLEIALKKKIEVSSTEEKKPDLLHAKLGAYFAKTKYDVADNEILSSIECHTTGKPNMTLFEKIIYIADYIEPGRDKMPRLDIIRKAAFEDIDKCMIMILEDTVAYLKSSGMYIDETTLKTYDFYIK